MRWNAGWRGLVRVVVVALTVAALPGGAAESPPPPAAGWEAPVLVSATQAARETSIALSPTDPDIMAVCDPSGVPNAQNNQSYFHRSIDGGATWKFMDVEGGQTDSRNYAFEGGDCDVIFDAAGTMYSADTWLGSLSIGASRDGGETWDGTAIAATTPVVDRPWLVGGPPGTVYVSYQDLQCCLVSVINFTKSTDYGKTFSPAVPVATATHEGAFTWEGNLVAAPDGQDLYLIYTRRQRPAVGSLDSMGPETVWLASSHDGGMTWSSTKIAAMPNPASYLYPSLSMDAGGNLHAVFSSRRDADRPIWYTFSSDQGQTWREPEPLTTGGVGYGPWIAAGASGEAAVVWLGSPDPQATESTDSDWYFYWARVTGSDTGEPLVASGTTTTAPMFTGRQTMPEFEMVRLDDQGRMHIGMSVYRRDDNGRARWAIYYQRETAPPAVE